MRNFFEYLIQIIKTNTYITVKRPEILVRFLFIYGTLTFILIFLYFHQENTIIPIIESVRDLFSIKDEIVEIEPVKPIEEPKTESQSNEFSTTTIIIGVTLTVVVLSGSTGVGLIILSIVGASGGWVGA
jgi:hypothetical protein